MEDEKGSTDGAELNRRRQQKFKDKQRAIKAGTFQLTPLDQAKEALKGMANMSIEALLSDPMFQGKLAVGDIEKLKTFIKNKSRGKRSLEDVEHRLPLEQDANQSMALRFENQLLPELHQLMIKPQSQEEKKMLILQSIHENLFLYLEYLEARFDTSTDTQQILISLKEEIGDLEFTQIFVRLCLVYQDAILEIDAEMVRSGIGFLVEQKDDSQAAYGLLRIIFVNSIDISRIPMDLIIRFQEQYDLALLNFFRSLTAVRPQIRESLPPTLLCFGTQLMASLSQGGIDLYQQVPPRYLPYFTAIVGYSFSTKQDIYQNFFLTFKVGVAKLYDRLNSSGFQELLLAMCQETKARNMRYFPELAGHTQTLEAAFDLLNTKKVLCFDPDTILALLSSEQEALSMVQSRPAISAIGNQRHLNEGIDYLFKINKSASFDKRQLQRPLQEKDLCAFKALGITTLLLAQELCLKWSQLRKNSGRDFVLYNTGQGKTALCFGIAYQYSLEGAMVVLLTPSESLSFRDYKKAAQARSSLGVDIFLSTETDLPALKPRTIVYSSIGNLRNLIGILRKGKPMQTILIIDEFDAILMDKEAVENSSHSLLSEFSGVIGFTGSDLQPHHTKFIKEVLNGTLWDFRSDASKGRLITQNSVRLCHTVKDHRETIVQMALECAPLTPLIIILNDGHEALTKELKKQEIPAVNLHNSPVAVIESQMDQFSKIQGASYLAFIIDEAQGRGLDFKTSPEVEENGGVHLIIAGLPSNYLQYRQYLGRTGRIGSKGTVTVILLDRQAKGLDPENYLKTQLEVLKNQDILFYSRYSSHQEEQEEFKEILVQNANNGEASMTINCNQSHRTQTLESENESSLKDQNCNVKVIVEHKADLDDENDEQRSKQLDCNINPHTSQVEEIAQEQCEPAPASTNKIRSKVREQEAKALIDEGYFRSYEDPAIHHEMVNDTSRMKAYGDAINGMCAGKIVIDVGAGTGVLSCLAAKAGASKVYALERSSIYREALKMVERNQMSDVVEVIHGLAENFNLTEGKADVIISEWMGYMLLYENMLPSVLSVRDQCLKEGGVMVPRKAHLLIAAYQRPQLLQGIDFSALASAAQNTAENVDCPFDWITSKCQAILTIDLAKDHWPGNYFESRFELEITKGGNVNGIVSWFTAELCDGISLSASPGDDQTHWHQTMLNFKDIVKVQDQEILRGSIKVEPQPGNYRALQITVRLENDEARKISKRVFNLD